MIGRREKKRATGDESGERCRLWGTKPNTRQNTMKHRILPLLATALLLGATAAQDPVRPTTEARQANFRISINFAGGSLTEYANALTKAGENVNIVLSDLAQEVRVPAMTLRNTSVEAALRAVCDLPMEVFDLDLVIHTSRAQGAEGLHSDPIYQVRIRELPNKGNKAVAAPRRVRVFSLHELTTAQPDANAQPPIPVATLVTAIDTGLSLLAETTPSNGEAEPKALVRFHEESNLLFAAGSPWQLDVIEQVLARLEADRASSRGFGGGGKRPPQDLLPPAPADPTREPALPQKPKERR